ncbi:YciK family oxidoreductase [Candidatus Rariloculus sp.]|uniref:YciK family oxidoreductase n=1 Tax=Candidatus Rariloculus sp. TaxID=3101265 RepID=UPI003D151556
MSDYRHYTPEPDCLADRVVLVTGATRGIGRAVARDLVVHGATVLLHGRDAAVLEALHQELRGLGPEPAVAQLDFERAQGDEYQRLTEQIEARYGRLDGLLHNAGLLGDRSPVEHYDIGLWQRVIHVNLNAAFILTRCLLPLMGRSEDASIVFTTSGVGQRGRAYWGAYSVSKFGVEGLAQVLADELENTSIRVNRINPGPARTQMRARAYPAEDPAVLVRPEELTGPYLFLLGRAGHGVSGQRLQCQP